MYRRRRALTWSHFAGVLHHYPWPSLRHRLSVYVVLACPLTDETRGLISSEELQTMGPESVLINIARDDVVDEQTLVRALQSGWVRGAALDVFSTEPLPADSPLWELSNVIVTPHMAGFTTHYIERSAAIDAEN
jgi:phosphoglycerate dehydrogenase-like enzyme